MCVFVHALISLSLGAIGWSVTYDCGVPYQVAGFDTHFFQRKIVNISLPTSFNIYFGCSKEPSH